LIEIRAAVAVAALIVTAVYGVAASTITSQRRAEGVLAARKEGAAILDLVCEDLFCAVYRDKEEAFVIGEGSDPKPFGFVGVVWDPESGKRVLAEVGYDYAWKDTKMLLYRRVGELEGSLTKGGKEFLISDELRSWKIEAFDGEEWQDKWEDTKYLPVAVRIEFAIDQREGEPLSFWREVALPASNLVEPVTLPKEEVVQ
jgi:hypothetical protein